MTSEQDRNVYGFTESFCPQIENPCFCRVEWPFSCTVKETEAQRIYDSFFQCIRGRACVLDNLRWQPQGNSFCLWVCIFQLYFLKCSALLEVTIWGGELPQSVFDRKYTGLDLEQWWQTYGSCFSFRTKDVIEWVILSKLKPWYSHLITVLALCHR